MPAGCGLGQIKSLIHEGGWEEGEREWESRRDGEGEAETDGGGGKNRMGALEEEWKEAER